MASGTVLFNFTSQAFEGKARAELSAMKSRSSVYQNTLNDIPNQLQDSFSPNVYNSTGLIILTDSPVLFSAGIGRPLQGTGPQSYADHGTIYVYV
jgi:hypothetical protein